MFTSVFLLVFTSSLVLRQDLLEINPITEIQLTTFSSPTEEDCEDSLFHVDPDNCPEGYFRCGCYDGMMTWCHDDMSWVFWCPQMCSWWCGWLDNRGAALSPGHRLPSGASDLWLARCVIMAWLVDASILYILLSCAYRILSVFKLQADFKGT